MVEANGSYKIYEELEARLGVIENEITEQTDVMRKGFQDVAKEIRLTREQGFLPLSVVEKMVDKNDARSSRNFDKVVTVLVLILTVVLGLKIMFPQVLK